MQLLGGYMGGQVPRVCGQEMGLALDLAHLGLDKGEPHPGT